VGVIAMVQDPVLAAVEEALRQVFLHERKITFLSLADRFPEYRWSSLLTALCHLQQQRVVCISLTTSGCEIMAASRPQPKTHS